MTLSLIVESSAGTIDLTPYLDVNVGAGLDPSDPQFTNKVFAHSLLKQGGTLALEDLKLRELTFPLKLNATSKDKLTALVREINTIINTKGCKASWTDESTTTPTFFTLASGQLDPEFDFRMGQATHPWLKAKLRLFVQPLGAKTTTMTALSRASGATSQATAPVYVFYASGIVPGDAPALVRGVVEPEFIGGAGYSAFSYLPNASYSPWIPAASQTQGAGWVRGASKGFNFYAGNGEFTVPRASGVYPGTHRVLAIARRFNNATPATLTAEVENAKAPEPNEAVVVGGASKAQPWNVLDLGVVRLPTDQSLMHEWTLRIEASATVGIHGFVLLPENSTSWLKAIPQSPTFDGELERVLNINGEDYTPQARGQIPELPAIGATPVFAAFGFALADEEPAVTRAKVSVLPRTRYVF